MYVAEKELCKGTLIELEKLNDVAGFGRNAKKKKPPPPPQETVLEFRGGVMQRVSVIPAHCRGGAASSSGDAAPSVGEGSELLAGLSKEQRDAILLGEEPPHSTTATAADFHRPGGPEVASSRWAATEQYHSSEPSGGNTLSLRAPLPSWGRRRHEAVHKAPRNQQRRWQIAQADVEAAEAAAEATTDDDDEMGGQQAQALLPSPIKEVRLNPAGVRAGKKGEGRRKKRTVSCSLRSFDMEENDDE